MSDDESDFEVEEEVEEEEEVTDLSNRYGIFIQDTLHWWFAQSNFVSFHDNYAVISDVCTKYQEASRIVNLALTGLVSQAVAGAKVIDLCQVIRTYLRIESFSGFFFNFTLSGLVRHCSDWGTNK